MARRRDRRRLAGGALRAPPLERIAAIAEDAGRAILGHYRKGVAVERKPDSSPVTVADRDAEALIVRALRAIDPATPIVAEEAVAAGAAPGEGGKRFWLVDPLDGTREFIAETGEFTVNIALVEDGVPVLGAVHAPALGETYGGFVSDGAWRSRGGGARQRISTRAMPAEGPTVLSSRRHGDRERLARLLASMDVAAHRTVGSSLKFCLLAAGEADIYPRYGETNEWDTAAGHAVLLAAGGSVSTVDDAPLGYGKAGFLNPEFIARGRG